MIIETAQDLGLQRVMRGIRGGDQNSVAAFGLDQRANILVDLRRKARVTNLSVDQSRRGATHDARTDHSDADLAGAGDRRRRARARSVSD